MEPGTTSFDGRVAFVTGGSSGIGLGITKALRAAGAKVAFTYRRSEHRDEALGQLGSVGPTAVMPVQLDVTDRNAWLGAVATVEDALGPIDLLFNNAGVGLTGPSELASYDDWDWVLGTNLGGVVNGVVTLVPRMIERKRGGHIINTASFGGLVATAWAGPYITSKFAVVGLSEALRSDLHHHNIRVSVFCPGTVRTRIADSATGRPPHLKETGYSQEFIRRVFGSTKIDDSTWMDADEAGKRALDGVRQNALYILTHPEQKLFVDARAQAISNSWPDEPINTARLDATRRFFYNGIYFGRGPFET